MPADPNIPWDDWQATTDPPPPEPPFRGAWVFTDGRWHWCAYRTLHVLIDQALAENRDAIVVPERSAPTSSPEPRDT